jgi:hypothetical protein
MANEPIQDNILGLFANQCANTFCHVNNLKEKDGLELWLTLYQARNIEYIPVNISKSFTPFEVANLCVMMAITGFTFGFLIQKFIIEYIKEE